MTLNRVVFPPPHPQQTHQLPLPQMEGDIPEHLVVPKGQADVAYFQLVHGYFWGR